MDASIQDFNSNVQESQIKKQKMLSELKKEAEKSQAKIKQAFGFGPRPNK